MALAAEETYTELLRDAASRLGGHQRRLFQAGVCDKLCGGNARVAERRFGWGRQTVAAGGHERRTGVRCLADVSGRGRRRAEDLDPQLAADVQAIVEPRSHADPELKSARVYSTP